MDKTKSSVADQSSGAVPRRRTNIRMIQNVLLIWLDNNIDTNDPDCYTKIAQLRYVVNSINTFTDRDQCVDFLTDISSEKVCMIISGTLCENIVPLIHDVAQLHTIFIFCENKTEHEKWAEAWSKIKGVLTEISSIHEALKKAAQQCEQNAIPISFIDTSDDISKKDLDQLDQSFMYTQILKEILLTIKFQQQHITEFVDYWCEQFVENDHELKNAKKFQEKYQDETPIMWYTRDPFLYSMLNRALRLMDVDVIIKMGFFIADLHRHIEELHSKQFGDDNSGNSFTVYRGQGISKDDFEKMTKTKGGLISFNNFLSTSENHDVSLCFAESNQWNSDLVAILFVITIDPSKSTIPFASINYVSYYKNEDEVLFAMHSVFRIRDITSMGENNRLFRVDLTLTSDKDKDLCMLTDRIREETSLNVEGFEGWGRLGLLLVTIGEFDKAQQVFEILEGQTTTESQKAPLYNEIGWVKRLQAKYEEAIAFFEKSLKIYKETWPMNHHYVAWPYHNLGVTYCYMSKYSEALPYHKKALEIRQQSLPPNHPDLATSYNAIGSAYRGMRKNSEALSYYEKALKIRLQSLPPNHPDLATSYNAIGSAYRGMRKYSEALSCYENALKIRQGSLPPNHSTLGDSYSKIGAVYIDMGEYSKALLSHEKALKIRQQSLPPNHPSLGDSYSKIGAVYEKMGNYSKAHSFYECAQGIKK